MKLFQSDLYDSIKEDGNHVISLSQPQTISFLLFAILRHHGYELHDKYGSRVTLIVVPDREKAHDRERLIRDHTDFKVVNLFNQKTSNEDQIINQKDSISTLPESTQVIIGQLEELVAIRKSYDKKVNLVILDQAHQLMYHNISLVQDLALYQKEIGNLNSKLLVFMCSFIHNNHDLSAIDTMKLISRFESLFSAKCETFGDLRCISRQAPSTPVEVLEFNPTEAASCDWFFLVDSMLKEFCQFVLDQSLDNNEPLIKPEPDLEESGETIRAPLLSLVEQLIMVRSCLADVLYSLHFLGFWCTKTTIKLYLSEFSRLLRTEQPVGDLIGAVMTMLNAVYGRLDELMVIYTDRFAGDTPLETSSPQLKALLEAIVEFKPTTKTSWPICIVHVRRRVIAKVIAYWLDYVSSKNPEYEFIKPNYIVGSSRKHRNRMAVDNFDLHHEAAVREVRFGFCNVLLSAVVNYERSTDMPRCNLVVSIDPPAQFSEYIQAKGNCRYDCSKYIIMVNKYVESDCMERLLSYVNMERLLNEVDNKSTNESIENSITESLEQLYKPYPCANTKNPLTIWKSISIINRYCSKLPSDSFTKLSPEWYDRETRGKNGQTYYFCKLRLPVNSPERQIIIGPVAPTKSIAMRLAAYSACKILHKHGELDDSMNPITKESMRASSNSQKEGFVQRSKLKGRASTKGHTMGSTKRRQYYKKSIAQVFSGSPVGEHVECNLYKFNMILTCPLPEEQNRRGRRIVDPGETSRNFAIVCTTKLPRICAFPVFTRSGEVLISVELVQENFKLTSQQVLDLRTFHQYTFSQVLRLEKYPIIYAPERSGFTVLLAPVMDESPETVIDWEFVQRIVDSNKGSIVPSDEERKSFKFNHSDYEDAVVIPWYRMTDRQQFAYYVAEICTELKPTSQFPDEESGFETFVDYYQSKYNITIFNRDQPVLDVDHTSARLNLLTPRYVNRKGRTLPSSTAKTRRESRESLVQKQLLIPELCSIHPFPASFWRKAVCLPCIFYRLNSLYLAEELRRRVVEDVGIGSIDLPDGKDWPILDFGWSLKQVIESGQTTEDKKIVKQPKKDFKNLLESRTKTSATAKSEISNRHHSPHDEGKTSSSTEDGENDFIIDHFDPSKYVIPDCPVSEPTSDWAKVVVVSSTGGCSLTPSGWDQPIQERDLFIEETNEATLSDCEIEFEGEVTERQAGMRLGSPSRFDPKSSAFFSLRRQDKNEEDFDIQRGLSKVRIDDNVFDDDSWPVQSMDLIKQQQAPKTQCQDASSSDGSWSLTDDEEEGEPSSFDDDPRGYGEWKDSKVKNGPLIREIFLPTSGSIHRPNESDVLQIYNILNQHPIDDSDQPLEEREEQAMSLTANTVSSIRTKIVEGNSVKGPVSVYNSLNGRQITVDDETLRKACETWFGLMNKLSLSVDASLAKNEGLFKHNAIELITVDDSLETYCLEPQPTFGELLPNRETQSEWPSEDWKNIRFDPSVSEIKTNGPGPSVILQALTMSNASDGINLERLETVGDSFLKYSITAYLHCAQPSMHEGKLSYLRSTEISNANLYLLGRNKSLGELMSATKFEPNDNWLAPGYTVADGDSSSQSSPNKTREIDKALAEVPYDLILQHSIPDKSIADCVEALIGAYLTSAGSRAALLFMHWLGLKVLPDSYNRETELKDAQGLDDNARWRWLDTPPSPLLCMEPYFDYEISGEQDHISRYMKTIDEIRQTAESELLRIYHGNNLDKFEKKIQYTFKDKAFLVQAFTHNSFYENRVTDCHQRLEFLGDALLDYLITRYLFEDPRCHSPGTLTDLRSALVNNTFFASLAVKYQFHKYLQYISDELFQVIDGFVKKFRFDTRDTIAKGYTLLISEGESEYAEDIEVPKALGDVFESVAGAIYLDSDMSLDKVWQVYFRMMKPEIEYFSSNVPKSPIRELLESMPQNVRFSPSELAPDRKHRVIAEVFGLGRFTGVGRNKHSAKSTAAKRALRMLALKQRDIEEQQGKISSNEEISIR